MPDPNVQAAYDELTRRGAFKGNPDAMAAAQELARRGVIRLQQPTIPNPNVTMPQPFPMLGNPAQLNQTGPLTMDSGYTPPPLTIPPDQRAGLADFAAQRAAELGITAPWARAVGINPAVQAQQAYQATQPDPRAGTEQGSAIEGLFPGFDEAAQEAQGLPGIVGRLVSGFTTPENLYSLGIAGGLGKVAGLARPVSAGFAGLGLKGAYDAAQNQERQQSDPVGYWGDIAANLGLAGMAGAHAAGVHIPLPSLSDLANASGLDALNRPIRAPFAGVADTLQMPSMYDPAIKEMMGGQRPFAPPNVIDSGANPQSITNNFAMPFRPGESAFSPPDLSALMAKQEGSYGRTPGENASQPVGQTDAAISPEVGTAGGNSPGNPQSVETSASAADADLSHEVDASVASLDALNAPHAGRAQTQLNRLEKLGIDVTDASDALQAYRDATGAEKVDAWAEFKDALKHTDATAEAPSTAPLPSDTLAQDYLKVQNGEMTPQEFGAKYGQQANPAVNDVAPAVVPTEATPGQQPTETAGTLPASVQPVDETSGQGAGTGKRPIVITAPESIQLSGQVPGSSFERSMDKLFGKGQKNVNVPMTTEQLQALCKIAERTPDAPGFKQQEFLAKVDAALSAEPGTALHAGFNPLTPLIEKANELGFPDAVRNAFKEGGSHLRAMDRQSFEKAVEHSSSAAQVNVFVREHLPEVLKHLNPVDQERFGAYAVADRALTERDSVDAELVGNRKTLAELDKDISDLQTAQKRKRLPFDKKLELQKQIEAKQSERADLQTATDKLTTDRANNIITRNESGGADPFTDPVTGNPITEDDVQRFMAKKSVRKAVAEHKARIEPELEKNFATSGRAPAGDRGKYSDMFLPAYALDENGNPMGGMGATGGGARAPLHELPSVPGARKFSGTGKDYIKDYKEAVERRLFAGKRVSTMIDMFRTMHENEVLQPVKIPGKTAEGADSKAAKQDVPNPYVRQIEVEKNGKKTSQTQINVNGEWVRASSPFNIQDKIGFTNVGQKYADLPTHDVVMPATVYNEIKGFFDRKTPTDLGDYASQIGSTAVMANIAGLGDAAAHGRAITSRLAKMLPMVGKTDSATGKLMTDWLPQINSMLAHKDTFGRMGGKGVYDVADRRAAAMEAAKAGALPAEWGLSNEPGDTKVQKLLKTSGRALYGEQGLLINAHTTIYKAFKDAGLLNAKAAGYEANVNEMREMMRNLNTYTDFLQPGVRKGLQQIPGGSLVGTFFQTGVKNRSVNFYGKGENAYRPYVTRLVGSLLLTSMLAKTLDKEHRWPWQIPGYRPGSIPTGTDEKGAQTYLNISDMFDRAQGYADLPVRTVEKGIALGDSPGHIARQLKLDALNQGLETLGSGPGVPLLAELLRRSPYLVLDDKLRPDLLASRTADLPENDPRRLAALAQHLVPLLNLPGNIDEGMSRTHPTGAGYEWANRILRFTGSPTISELPTGLAYMHRKAERAAAVAERKAQAR
jgi:hypothetical protein